MSADDASFGGNHNVAPTPPPLKHLTWTPPAATALPVAFTVYGSTNGGDFANPSGWASTAREPRPDYCCPVYLDASSRQLPDNKTTAPSGPDQQTWLPPAVSKQAISITAGGVGVTTDGMFVQPMSINPEMPLQPPHQVVAPRPVDRLPVMPDAAHSASLDGNGTMLAKQTWTPPAATTSRIAATANSPMQPTSDYNTIGGFIGGSSPQPQLPGPVDLVRPICDAADVASTFEERTWTRPRVAVLSLNATANVAVSPDGDLISHGYMLTPDPQPQPRPPHPPGEFRASDVLKGRRRLTADKRSWLPPTITSLPIGLTTVGVDISID